MNEEFKEVVEETNENVEAQTTEETEEGIELTDTAEVENSQEENNNTEEKEEDSKSKGRFVTDEELNDLVNKRVARKMSKLERDYEKKYADYQDTEAVLNAGLGTSNIQEANKKMREYYQSEGINIPEPIKPGYSKHEIEVLAKDEANEFIEDGYNAMLDEANRLASKGYSNMNDREKIIFTTLSEKLTEENDKKTLKSLGANEDLLNDKNWKEFRNQFTSQVPIDKIYALYKGTQSKPKIENPGSMKNTPTEKVKESYTDEEISKLTLEDLDKPGVFEAVRRSMTSQK